MDHPIRATAVIIALAKALDASAWEGKTCVPGSFNYNRRIKTIARAGKLWKAIAPMIKEAMFDSAVQTLDEASKIGTLRQKHGIE